MTEDKKFVIRCRAIILNENKLLVVRHAKDMSFAALPGGHLEWGEDVKECMRREIIEELGVEPQIGRLLYINTFLEGDHIQPIEFFFEVTNGSEYIGCEQLARSHAHELAEICWVSPEDDIKILPLTFAKDFKEGLVISDEVRYLK